MAFIQEKVEQKLIRLKRKIEDKERDVFHTRFPKNPKHLYQELYKKHKHQLDSLLKKGVINQDQYETVLPNSSRTDSNKFDTTLLHVLLRSFCGFKRPPTGWNDEPELTDRSIIANLIRLKIGRNRIIHLGVAATTNTFYKRVYKYLKRPLLELGCTVKELQELVPKPLRYRFTSSVSKFASRKSEINDLQHHIGKVKINASLIGVCMSGLSGIGKSQIAKRYFERYFGDFEQGVVWINADNLEESFKELAIFLNLTIKDIYGHVKPIGVVIDEVHNFFQDDQILFIFDNLDVDFQSINSNSVDDILKYFPNHNSVVSIITSRFEMKNPKFITQNIRPLEQQSAVNHAKTYPYFQGTSHEKLLEILEILGNHPLAIEQCISYVIETRIPIDNYLELLKNNPAKLISSSYQVNASALIKLTIDKLQNIDQPYALNILEISVYLNGKGIRREFYVQYLKCHSKAVLVTEICKDVCESLAVLQRLSLITIEPDSQNDSMNDIITIHSLVQETLKYLLQQEKRDELVYSCLLEAVFSDRKQCKNDTTFYNAENYLHFHKQIAYIFQAHSFQNNKIMKIFVQNVRSIFNIFNYCDRYDLCESILLRIIEYCQQHSNNNKQSLFLAQIYLGWCYLHKMDFEPSCLLLEEAKITKRKIFRLKRENILLMELASCRALTMSNKTVISQPLANHVYASHLKYYGKLHPHTILSKSTIALNFFFTSDRRNAVKLYREVLADTMSVYGKNHLQFLYIKHNLAMADNVTPRLSIFNEILEELHRSCGREDNNSFVLLVKANIAKELCSHGRYNEALSHFEDVYYQMLIKYGENHKHVKDILRYILYLKVE